jgi:Protein of unknown function (DUF3105)
MVRARTRVSVGFSLLFAWAAQGCAGDDMPAGMNGGAGSSPDSDGGGQVIDAGADAGDSSTATGSGACKVMIRAHALAAPTHVVEPLPASAYNSNPPSSGSHCGSWGRYGVYTEAAPLAACNFVHNLEHGAVAVLYDCPDGCDDTVATLQAAIDAAGPDPDCAQSGGKRVVLTPYADMDSAVGASAWGFTFTADCLDEDASSALTDFIKEHWGSRGQAPEATVCANGS